MRSAYDVEQIRAAEAPLLDSLPAGTLMQRAATALAPVPELVNAPRPADAKAARFPGDSSTLATIWPMVRPSRANSNLVFGPPVGGAMPSASMIQSGWIGSGSWALGKSVCEQW